MTKKARATPNFALRLALPSEDVAILSGIDKDAGSKTAERVQADMECDCKENLGEKEKWRVPLAASVIRQSPNKVTVAFGSVPCGPACKITNYKPQRT